MRGKRFLTEIVERDGVLRAKVYGGAGKRETIAMLACVATPSGGAALRELLRLSLERVAVRRRER